MKNVISLIGRLASFDFVGNFFLKKLLDKGAAALTGILFSPVVTAWLPAALPGDPAAWETFVAAVLAGVLGGIQNAAKHYAGKP